MSRPIVPPAPAQRSPRGLSGREVLAVLGSLAVVVLLARLGVWQLDRGREKQALAARIAARERLSPLRLGPQGVDLARAQWRPAVARGEWVGAWTVYLQNRQYRGVSGFWVLTPLRLQGSDRYLMVLRGWAAPDVHAPLLMPPIPTPSGPVEVRGRVAPAPSPWFSFAKDPPGARLRQNVQLQQFAQYHHILMFPYVLQQLGPSSQGLVREWPKPDVGMQRNYGYALQWFAMSATCLGLWLYFTLRTLVRRRRRAPGAAA